VVFVFKVLRANIYIRPRGARRVDFDGGGGGGGGGGGPSSYYSISLLLVVSISSLLYHEFRGWFKIGIRQFTPPKVKILQS